jgi:glutamine synthetase
MVQLSDVRNNAGDWHYVKVAGIDVDGILRGKIMSRSKFNSAKSDGFGFCR